MAFLGRLVAAAGKTLVTAAVNRAATELRKPETQAKLHDSAQRAVQTLRDPATRETIEHLAGIARDRGARALGRAVGRLQHAIGDKTPEE